jgi:hypothetical protein
MDKQNNPVDLSKEEIDTLLRDVDHKETFEKESKISWDGTNFIARIPKEFGDFLGLTIENREDKRMVFTAEEKEGVVIHNIKIKDIGEKDEEEK